MLRDSLLQRCSGILMTAEGRRVGGRIHPRARLQQQQQQEDGKGEGVRMMGGRGSDASPAPLVTESGQRKGRDHCCDGCRCSEWRLQLLLGTSGHSDHGVPFCTLRSVDSGGGILPNSSPMDSRSLRRKRRRRRAPIHASRHPFIQPKQREERGTEKEVANTGRGSE